MIKALNQIIFTLCLVFIIFSCSEQKNEKPLANKVNAADALANSSAKIDTGKNISTIETNDSVIIAKFQKDSIATTISGLLKEAPRNVVVYINIKQGKKLSAVIHSKNANANIRINQFFTPDGKADGPFGKEINKPIIEQGMYKLIIGHDLMAEGGSEVKFELRLTVK